MKNTALLVALSLTALACDSDSSEGADGGLGSVALSDTTDATGKADALNGRAVYPGYTDIVAYGPETKRGISTVTEIDDSGMSMQAPMVEFPAVDEYLQISVAGGNEDTQMRFFLAYASDEENFRIVTVQGQGEFEDGAGPDGDGAQAVPVEISYFQSISIDARQNIITVTSDDAGGETTSDLAVDAAAVTFYALALPVDSGWGNDLVGDFEFQYEAKCDGLECGEQPAEPDAPVDDYAQARDVNLDTITIGGPAIDYTRASVDGFSLGGTEFWYIDDNGGIQKTFSYARGSEDGRKCMLASAIRFEAIMADPPAAIVELRDSSRWSGSFFNWNEDQTRPARGGWPVSAGLWAWTTGLVKWISVTNLDGTCSLPTRAIVEETARACLATAESEDGEIKGCAGGF